MWGTETVEREEETSVIIASAAQFFLEEGGFTSNIPWDRLVWGCATVSLFLIKRGMEVCLCLSTNKC